MFRILNLKFGYYLGFRILCLGFFFIAFVPNANAGLIFKAPSSIGLISGLVGYLLVFYKHKNRLGKDSFRGVDPAGLKANVFAFNGRHIDSLKCAQEFCEGQNLHSLHQVLTLICYCIHHRPGSTKVIITKKPLLQGILS